MAHQWEGIIATVGPATGNTTITIGQSTFASVGNINLWDKAMFMVSFSQHPAAPGIGIFLTTTIAGSPSALIPIAGFTGIATTQCTALPITAYTRAINGSLTAGITDGPLFVGIPLPKQIVVGRSAIVGATYAFTLYGMLRNQ